MGKLTRLEMTKLLEKLKSHFNNFQHLIRLFGQLCQNAVLERFLAKLIITVNSQETTIVWNGVISSYRGCFILLISVLINLCIIR